MSKQEQANPREPYVTPRGHRDYLRIDRLTPYRRGIGFPSFILATWSTDRTDSRGQTTIGYELVQVGRFGPRTIFTGEDFNGNPMHADDSRETALTLLGFLTLRPGDTDASYFAHYTPEQEAFADEHAELLAAIYGDLDWLCEDQDPGCPTHKGDTCNSLEPASLFERGDMANARVRLCPACAADALDSGVFYPVEAF